MTYLQPELDHVLQTFSALLAVRATIGRVHNIWMDCERVLDVVVGLLCSGWEIERLTGLAGSLGATARIPRVSKDI